MRQIILDTETTGLEPEQGHRIVEIGCVELVNRRVTGETFHQYLNPQRAIDEGALDVHGISNADLADKPLFGDIVEELFRFIDGAELVIHNAPFDVAFINYELSLLARQHDKLETRCKILDTLTLARDLHPGQRNSLDALCKRYQVDNSARSLHGALLDARILADVYVAMTGGQGDLSFARDSRHPGHPDAAPRPVQRDGLVFVVAAPSDAELAEHRRRLEQVDKASRGKCLWLEDAYAGV